MRRQREGAIRQVLRSRHAPPSLATRGRREGSGIAAGVSFPAVFSRAGVDPALTGSTQCRGFAATRCDIPAPNRAAPSHEQAERHAHRANRRPSYVSCRTYARGRKRDNPRRSRMGAHFSGARGGNRSCRRRCAKSLTGIGDRAMSRGGFTQSVPADSCGPRADPPPYLCPHLRRPPCSTQQTIPSLSMPPAGRMASPKCGARKRCSRREPCRTRFSPAPISRSSPPTRRASSSCSTSAPSACWAIWPPRS